MPPDTSRRIFEGLGPARANFTITATNVRHGERQPRHFVLADGAKWKSVIDKWRFEPKKEPLSRCGYDYMVVVTNGDTVTPVSICFVCNTLIFNHQDMYASSRKQIMALLGEDFRPVR